MSLLTCMFTLYSYFTPKSSHFLFPFRQLSLWLSSYLIQVEAGRLAIREIRKIYWRQQSFMSIIWENFLGIVIVMIYIIPENQLVFGYA